MTKKKTLESEMFSNESVLLDSTLELKESLDFILFTNYRVCQCQVHRAKTLKTRIKIAL